MDKKLKTESVIPKGIYCYDEKGTCPYWSCEVDYEEDDWMKMRPTMFGKCSFLDISDRTISGLLWDQCKECGINDDDEDEIITIN